MASPRRETDLERRIGLESFRQNDLDLLNSPLRQSDEVARKFRHKLVVRAVIHLRELIASNKPFAKELIELERRVERRLADQDGSILDILEAVCEFTVPPSSDTKTRPHRVHHA